MATATMQDVFQRFCAAGSSEMDGGKFAKFARDCKVLNAKVTATDVDLVFAKVKAKGARRIAYPQFVTAIGMLAAKRYPSESPEDARAKLELHCLSAGGGPKFKGTKAATGGIYGKLTDASQYTGAHVHRFDETGHGRGRAGRTDAGKCGDLSEVTRPNLRGPAHDALVATPRDPAALMAAAEEREAMARAQFAHFDKDGSGWLNEGELATLLSEMGFDHADIKAEYATADTDGDGKVDFSEFVVFFNALQARKMGEAPPARKPRSGGGASRRAAPKAGSGAGMPAGESALESSFLMFCRYGAGSGAYHTDMDNKNFAKLARDTGLLGKKVTSTDVDLIFTKVKAKGSRRISFAQFQQAVTLLGQKFNPRDPEAGKATVIEKVSSHAPQAHGATVADTTGIYGKMTDQSLYTGAHKARFS